MTIPKQKKIPDPEPVLSVARMVEDIIGCKWSLTVLNLIRQGVHRPGAMRRGVEGLTTKVLNERLRKLTRFGIVEKRVFPEIPPHVEYTLTAFGHKFSKVLESIQQLEAEQERMKNEE